MKAFHLAFCIPFLVNAASANTLPSAQAEGFTVSINLKGLPDGTKLYLLAKKDADLGKPGSKYRDTVAVTTASGEKASFSEAIVNKGKLFVVSIEGQKSTASLLISNKEKISVRGTMKEWPKVKVSGSKGTAQMTDFQSYLSNKIMNQKGAAISTGIAKYAKANPDNLYLPLIMLQSASMTSEEKKAAFEKLSPVARDSYYGQLLSSAIYNNKLSEPLREGALIPEFRLRMLDGDTVSIREIAKKNKLTLIDYWGTWCGPCVGEFPFLKQVYAQFKDKGFSILGITQNEQEQGWRKAIDNHGINWQHGADEVDDARGKVFRLNSIPAYTLIDQEGKVIAFIANGSKASEPFGPPIWQKGLITTLEELLK
ncbi:TlpA family protein disulfide reductase [Pseudoflavitalea rhizosphaerae]|uniref:TlpA family protein disulfide reductase n=1 Tax=Pseudoflavitalea rhizosphaerae TaxID=1884793 RepID=UPI000F8D0FF9|nr:TlpA disulfide reductase family protein [Pseudoflavitalea rhizosphaerae]